MLEQADLEPVDTRLVVLRWVIVALLGLGFSACIAKGANRPADPALVESRFPGFGETAIQVLTPGGPPTPAERCALLAATEAQRRQGLMEVTDLKGYAGMVFRFSADTTGGFWMRNTPMPLSVAFFAADGIFVSAADLEPCPDVPDCPSTGAAGPYRFALEVPQGKLAELGVGPGARLVLGPRCPQP